MEFYGLRRHAHRAASFSSEICWVRPKPAAQTRLPAGAGALGASPQGSLHLVHRLAATIPALGRPEEFLTEGLPRTPSKSGNLPGSATGECRAGRRPVKSSPALPPVESIRGESSRRKGADSHPLDILCPTVHRERNSVSSSQGRRKAYAGRSAIIQTCIAPTHRLTPRTTLYAKSPLSGSPRPPQHPLTYAQPIRHPLRRRPAGPHGLGPRLDSVRNGLGAPGQRVLRGH